MNRKQSHQISSQGYGQGPYKITYQVNSPYVQLLESKKKVYGHKYDQKANRSFTSTVSQSKPYHNSFMSVFNANSKLVKHSSNQKTKNGRSGTNEKKRVKTEAQEKMHESLYVYPSATGKQEAVYLNKEEKISEFHSNPYFNELSKKNKRKRNLSENRSQRNQVLEPKHFTLGALQNLQISDIDELIALIDNCTQEANDYIAYICDKMESLKEELISAKINLSKCEAEIKSKNIVLEQKNEYIKKLDKQIGELKKGDPQTGIEIKNLLKVMERMNEENENLKNEIKSLREQKVYTNEKQMHNKIDILNISIDSNSPTGDKGRKQSNKKYKFIKPKGR